MLTVVLALSSALAYGFSDFLGGVLSRRTSAWSVAVVAQISSTACVSLVALTVAGHPSVADYRWGALAGVASGVGTGFLYRGFAAGRMAVVAPVSAVGAALVPVLVGALTGERPAPLAWVGIAVALPGVWLVSTTPAPAGAPVDDGRLAAGLVDGVLAGLGFGLLFAALGQIPSSAGLWPLALCQAVSLPAVVVLATLLGAAWRPRGRTVRWALAAGPLGAAATWFFLLATQNGLLTIARVIAALYPASTVLLAALVLRENVHRAQGVGLGLCAVAVVLVAGA